MAEIYDRQTNETPDQREEIVENQVGDEVHREHIVQNTAAERRQTAFRISQFIWLVFGVLEALIAIRVILKLIAANPSNPFANLIYSFTDLFLWPFFGLTATPAAGGMVLEISSVIGMIVYALIAWVLVKIVWLVLYRTSTQTVQTYDRDRRL